MFEGKNIHSSSVDGKLLCSYSEKVCMQRRLNGYAFCVRHILEDKNAPFKQCQFVTKYNGTKCINPVPISENRIYCNSHLIVLGLIQKKVKKKKDTGTENGNNVKVKNQQQSTQKNEEDENKGTEKSDKNKCKPPESKVQNTNKHKTKPLPPAPSQSTSLPIPSVGWNPYYQMWRKFRKRQKPRKNRHIGNIRFPEIESCRKVYKDIEGDSKDLLKNYMFDGTTRDVAEKNERLWQSPILADELVADVYHSEEYLQGRLKQHISDLKKSIKSKQGDRRLSYSVLNTLVTAAKTNMAATANMLAQREQEQTFRIRSANCSSAVQCIRINEEISCSKQALPYSRYCSNHIHRDDDQVLFGKCTAKFPGGIECSVPVIDLTNERPLCPEHSRKRAESVMREAAAAILIPTKKSKKAEQAEKRRSEQEEKKRTELAEREKKRQEQNERRRKQNAVRRNLKAQLQKKFAIPMKPQRKPNCHINSIKPATLVLSDDKPGLKLTLKVSKSSAPSSPTEPFEEGDEEEERIISPRVFDSIERSDSPLSPELQMESESLSSPSLSPLDDDDEDEDSSLGTIRRNHTNSFNFNEDEDILQNGNGSFNLSNLIPRDITSPTLNQLSADTLPNHIAYDALSSPPKLSIDRPTFEPPSPLKRLTSTPSLKRTLNSPPGTHIPLNNSFTFANSIGSPRLIGKAKVQPPVPGNSSLLNSSIDNYSIDGGISDSQAINRTDTVLLPPSTRTNPSSGNWSSKFTLPTRHEHIPPSRGFIRVSPSPGVHATGIYSPPFNLNSPRSKSQIFRFDPHGTCTALIYPRDPPPYSVTPDRTFTVEKQPEVEPPLQKVNPDIFLSTVFSETSNKTNS